MGMILDLSVNFNVVLLFSVTYVVGIHWNCIIEAIPMSPLCELTTLCLFNNQVFHHKHFLNKFSSTFIVSLKCACRNHHIIIIGFLINMQVQGHHPHQK